MATTKSNSSRLLYLPPELRTMIYTHVKAIKVFYALTKHYSYGVTHLLSWVCGVPKEYLEVVTSVRRQWTYGMAGMEEVKVRRLVLEGELFVAEGRKRRVSFSEGVYGLE